MPWHKELYPETDTVVICRVTQIDEYGVRVSILNYGGIEGFLTTNELSRKKIKSIRSVMKVGDIKPLLVIKTEKKRDKIFIDLSNKEISNIEYEVERLEKYFKLTTIIHTWLKYIYNSRYFLEGKYIGDLDESLETVANFEDTSLKTTNDSTNSFPIDEDEYEDETDTSSGSGKKVFPYGSKIWSKVMDLTLWKYPVGDIYDIFMDIKMKKKTVAEAFPELISEIQRDKLDTEIDEDQRIEIDIKDIGLNDDLNLPDTISHNSLIGLIDRYINYDISVKINLKMTCWSIGSLDTIKEIIDNISMIPDRSYDSQFRFTSILINSPLYEFVIKSTNKKI